MCGQWLVWLVYWMVQDEIIINWIHTHNVVSAAKTHESSR